MQTNIYLADDSEEMLQKLKPVAALNDVRPSKAYLIEMAIEIAYNVVQHLDDESFEQVTNFKK